jgi:hypothetical protein
MAAEHCTTRLAAARRQARTQRRGASQGLGARPGWRRVANQGRSAQPGQIRPQCTARPDLAAAERIPARSGGRTPQTDMAGNVGWRRCRPQWCLAAWPPRVYSSRATTAIPAEKKKYIYIWFIRFGSTQTLNNPDQEFFFFFKKKG